MLRLSRTSLTGLALLASSCVLLAMQAPLTDNATPAPATGAVAPAEADEAWESISQRANNLRILMQQGEFTTDSIRDAMRTFLVDVKAYQLDHQDDVRGWNLLASLCGELKDDACVDQCAAEILRIQPDNVQAGLQWTAYYASSDRIDRALEILDILLTGKPTSLMYHNAWILTARRLDPTLIEARFQRMQANPDTMPQAIAFVTAMRQSDPWTAVVLGKRLLETAPGDPEVIVVAARALRGTNQFAEARAILDKLPPDRLAQPRIAYLYSDTYYADHDFQRAYDIMSAIDLEAIDSTPGLKRRLKFMLPLRKTAIESWDHERQLRAIEAEREDNPRVRLMIDGAPVEIELFQAEAPNTVAAFLALASRGHYDDTPFGQVQTGFRSIGGTIPGLVPYTLPSECSKPEARHFFSGTLATYLPSAGRPDSANCEWCLYHFPAPHLNGKRTVFGRVTSGLDTVRAMREDAVLDSVEIIRPPDTDPEPDVLDATGQRRTFSEVMIDFDPETSNDNATGTVAP